MVGVGAREDGVAVRLSKWMVWTCGTVLAVCSAGCGPTASPSLAQRLQNENPHVRQEALIEAARNNRRDLLGYMVAALSDTDSVVRMTAILSLERMTGTKRGYRYFEPWDKRQAAIRRWRDWLRDEQIEPVEPAQPETPALPDPPRAEQSADARAPTVSP